MMLLSVYCKLDSGYPPSTFRAAYGLSLDNPTLANQSVEATNNVGESSYG